MPRFPDRRRWVGLGTLATGIACPCHVLAGALALATGSAALSPAAQDGVHAAYVPVAAVVGAWLLRGSLIRHRKH